jgi:hypothetical protein
MRCCLTLHFNFSRGKTRITGLDQQITDLVVLMAASVRLVLAISTARSPFTWLHR